MSVPAAQQAPYLESELADLRLRVELYEGDQKAFLESNHAQLARNRDEIQKLRARTRKIRNLLAKDDGSLRVSSVRDKEIAARHTCDLLAYDIKRKEAQVSHLRSQLGALRTSNPEEDKRLRSLETRLDKAFIKYHEAQSIRKAYDSILGRLRRERLKFDTLAQRIQANIRDRRKEYERLSKMGNEAARVRDESKSALAELELQMVGERKARDLRLHQLRALLSTTRADYATRDESLHIPPPTSNTSLSRSGKTASNLLANVVGGNSQSTAENQDQDLEWDLRQRFGVEDVGKLKELYDGERRVGRMLEDRIKEFDTGGLGVIREQLVGELERLRFQAEEVKQFESPDAEDSSEDMQLRAVREQVETIRTSLAHVLARMDHFEPYLHSVRTESIEELANRFCEKFREMGAECSCQITPAQLRPRVPLRARDFVEDPDTELVDVTTSKNDEDVDDGVVHDRESIKRLANSLARSRR